MNNKKIEYKKEDIMEFISNEMIGTSRLKMARFNKKWFENHSYLDMYEFIIESTDGIVNGNFFSERIYCIKNNIKSPKTCYCGKKLSFRSFTKGYFKFCSTKCLANSPKIVEKRKATMIKRYGVDNPSKDKSIQDKKKETFIKNFGVDHPMKNPKIVQRLIESFENRYGVSNPSCLDWVKQKKINTSIQNYGVEHPMQDRSVMLTSLTNRKIYYETHPILGFSHLPDDILNKLNDKDFMEKEYSTKNAFLMSKEIGVNPATIKNYLVKHGIKIVYKNNSNPQNEIFDFVKTGILNDRSFIYPLEIDILVPEKKLAIEFNGLYWHSRYGKEYHIKKTLLCEQKGFELIQLFENEWEYNREICESIINSRLDRNKKIEFCGAIKDGKCDEFFEENSLFGHCDLDVSIYNDYSAMGFVFDNGDWEIKRFCNKNGYDVVGSEVELFKYFIRRYNPKNVYYVDDLRIQWKNLLNFDLISMLDPILCEIDGYKVYNCGYKVYKNRY